MVVIQVSAMQEKILADLEKSYEESRRSAGESAPSSFPSARVTAVCNALLACDWAFLRFGRVCVFLLQNLRGVEVVL